MHQFYIAIGDVSVLGDQYLTSCLPKQISVHAVFFIRDIGQIQLVLSLKKSSFLTRLVSSNVSKI